MTRILVAVVVKEVAIEEEQGIEVASVGLFHHACFEYAASCCLYEKILGHKLRI